MFFLCYGFPYTDFLVPSFKFPIFPKANANLTTKMFASWIEILHKEYVHSITFSIYRSNKTNNVQNYFIVHNFQRKCEKRILMSYPMQLIRRLNEKIHILWKRNNKKKSTL